MLVPVNISRLLIREMADSQFVTLQEVDGSRSFPIAIGLGEAFAIERRMGGGVPPRPQTHDLLESVITTLGAAVVRIEIHDLDAGTFHARLVLEHEGGFTEVDSRPSDAIALGVATDTPIFVEDSVIEQAVVDSNIDGPANGNSPDSSGLEDDFDDDDSEFR